MTILLPTLAVTFAAFWIWLTVRIVNRRERWGKWTALGLIAMLAYPLSIGPMYWNSMMDFDTFEFVYRPILWAADESPAVQYELQGYLRLWMRWLR